MFCHVTSNAIIKIWSYDDLVSGIQWMKQIVEMQLCWLVRRVSVFVCLCVRGYLSLSYAQSVAYDRPSVLSYTSLLCIYCVNISNVNAGREEWFEVVEAFLFLICA